MFFLGYLCGFSVFSVVQIIKDKTTEFAEDAEQLIRQP